MDCSSDMCQKMPVAEQAADPRVIKAAETLACLLTETKELQEFISLARKVQTDRQANEILGRMNGFYDVDGGEDESYAELEERLESLPLIKEYSAAEQTVRDMLNAVDRLISESAGLPFAMNAQPAACG